MAYEIRDMSGSLFRSEDKDPNDPSHDKRADFSGQGLINGVPMWINGWVKTAKNGKKYFSLSFKPKDQQQRAQQGQGRQQAPQQPQQQGGYPNQSRDQQQPSNQRGGGGGGSPRTNWDRDPVDDIPFAPDR